MRRARLISMAVLVVVLVLATPLLRWSVYGLTLLLALSAVAACRRGWRLAGARLALDVGASLVCLARPRPAGSVLLVGASARPVPCVAPPRGGLRRLRGFVAGTRELVRSARTARGDGRAAARSLVEVFVRRLSPRARVVLVLLALAAALVSLVACAMLVVVFSVRAASRAWRSLRVRLESALRRLEPGLERLPLPSPWSSV